MAGKWRAPNRAALLASVALLCPTPCHASIWTAGSISSRRTKLPETSPSHHGNARHGNPRRAFIAGCNIPDGSTPYSFHSSNDAVFVESRGGALSNHQSKSTSINDTPKTSNPTIIATITILSLTILFSILNWETMLLSHSTFLDREKFRKSILSTLNSISSRGTKGLFLYSFGFIFWEMCGLPTSVVETAAGMAFGFREGLVGSFVGKSLGSIGAFLLGRSLLKQLVESNLGQNETLESMQKSAERHPVRSALIVRYSPFPQLVKNFGLSMLPPVSLRHFVLAIAVHGLPFSLLWAWLGYDSSLRLKAQEAGDSLEVNWILNGCLVFVTVFGFVVSPVVTGWWLADLRRDGDEKKKK